ncbi:alpha/beta hydrolase [Chitinophaga sp. 22620]|uniref:alpha/beta hydrolase n=1 Tax=Chitinophaga sp. 22620 TaxID=3453952 RepID=UPI003F86AD85
MKTIISVPVLLLFSCFADAQEKPIPLYENNIPNAKPAPADYMEYIDSIGLTHNVTHPTLTPYLPEKGMRTGTAVIICPGGGYAVLPAAEKNEAVAKEFNKIGIAAFVLKYRLPHDAIMKDKTNGPLQDAQTALLLVRRRAAEWGIRPDKIGFIGFSAGGHLASTAGTHFDRPVIENIDKLSLRPDFMLLVYPVIIFDPAIPSGVRERLVGVTPSRELLDLYSNEKHVMASTPPTFLVHAADDDVVPVKNSIAFFEALQRANVKTSMHIFQAGGHGFGLDNPGNKDKWFNWCASWLEENGF